MKQRSPASRVLIAATALFITTAPLGAEPMVIADFSEARSAQDWRFFSDQVMGGVSTGGATVENGALRLRGSVSTRNNGGFIQVRLEDVTLPDDATAFILRVKGDGQRYFLHVRTTQTRRPWHYYQAEFTTAPDWQDVRIPLSAFTPSADRLPGTVTPNTVRSVALVAYGRDHEVDVALDRISVD